MSNKVIITNVVCAVLIIILLWHQMNIIRNQDELIKQYQLRETILTKQIDSIQKLKKQDKKTVLKHSDSLVEVSGVLIKKITHRQPVRVNDTTYSVMCEYLINYKN